MGYSHSKAVQLASPGKTSVFEGGRQLTLVKTVEVGREQTPHFCDMGEDRPLIFDILIFYQMFMFEHWGRGLIPFRKKGRITPLFFGRCIMVRKNLVGSSV